MADDKHRVNLMTPEFAMDPIPNFANLRNENRLVRAAFPGAESPVWLITRYDDVRDALTDPRFVRDSRNVPGQDVSDIGEEMKAAVGLPEEYQQYMDTMATMDGTSHSRLRRLIHAWFSARSVSNLTPFVEKTADRLLAGLVENGGGDLVTDFAFPFTGDVIYHLLGLDRRDWPQLREWVIGYTSGLPELITPSLKGIASYVEDVVRRKKPGDERDLISGLINARQNLSDPITDVEIVSMVLLLIDTGQRPAAQFISNAVLVLLENPTEIRTLQENPDLLPHAVQETLRVATTVRFNGLMYATEDLEFAGSMIQRGEPLIAGLFSANYDPSQFSKPEQMDFKRNRGNETHVSFAPGPHYCVGAALGRLEAQIAFDRLFVRNPGLSLAVPRDKLNYRYGIGGYHLSNLPVHL